MQQNVRKQHVVCKNCKARYTGEYCPFCGTENGGKRPHRGGGGLLGGVLQFILTLVLLAILIAVAFIVLDYVASASGDTHTGARAILDSVRNAIPKGALDYYASIKAQYLDGWVASIVGFFNVLFS
jgi:hypothetical protein